MSHGFPLTAPGRVTMTPRQSPVSQPSAVLTLQTSEARRCPTPGPGHVETGRAACGGGAASMSLVWSVAAAPAVPGPPLPGARLQSSPDAAAAALPVGNHPFLPPDSRLFLSGQCAGLCAWHVPSSSVRRVPNSHSWERLVGPGLARSAGIWNTLTEGNALHTCLSFALGVVVV